jgi:hypothetical protein
MIKFLCTIIMLVILASFLFAFVYAYMAEVQYYSTHHL